MHQLRNQTNSFISSLEWPITQHNVCLMKKVTTNDANSSWFISQESVFKSIVYLTVGSTIYQLQNNLPHITHNSHFHIQIQNISLYKTCHSFHIWRNNFNSEHVCIKLVYHFNSNSRKRRQNKTKFDHWEVILFIFPSHIWC